MKFKKQNKVVLHFALLYTNFFLTTKQNISNRFASTNII